MKLDDLLKGGPQEEVEEGAPAWMATFADMATLLLTFFVLLLSFANMDVVKFKVMLGSVKDAFGVQKQTFGDYSARSSEVLDAAGQAEDSGEGQKQDQQASLQQALVVIESLFEDLGESVEVFLDEEGITVRVEGKLLFESGTADLRPEGAEVLNRVAALLARYTFDLYILGHTDSVPIQTARFPSNWELSGARASAGLRHVASRGADSRRLVAVGFADSRPIASNGEFEGRARNRRVEFLFKNPESLPTGEFKPAKP